MPHLPRRLLYIAIAALVAWILLEPLRQLTTPGASPLALRAHLGSPGCAADVALRAHIVAGVVALVLCPFVRHGQRGPVPALYLSAAVVAAGAALLRAPHAWGGPAAQLGLSLLALAWLTSSAAAAADHLVARADDRWWTLSCALTTTAILSRAQLGLLWGVGVPDAVAYAIVAWSSWLPHLVWWWRSPRTWAQPAPWAYPGPAPAHRTPG